VYKTSEVKRLPKKRETERENIDLDDPVMRSTILRRDFEVRTDHWLYECQQTRFLEPVATMTSINNVIENAKKTQDSTATAEVEAEETEGTGRPASRNSNRSMRRKKKFEGSQCSVASSASSKNSVPKKRIKKKSVLTNSSVTSSNVLRNQSQIDSPKNYEESKY
jgi:hypothetical protein